MKLRPGPQPENQIAGTAQEQLRRAMAGRQPEPLSDAEVERLLETVRARRKAFAKVIVEIIAEDIGAIASAVMDHKAKTAYRRDARAAS